MARHYKSELTFDDLRLLAFAVCLMVESAPDESRAQIQIDASLLAEKIGFVAELREAITMSQTARDAANSQ